MGVWRVPIPPADIICKGCGNVGRKVISLTKVGVPSSNFRGNCSRNEDEDEDEDEKKRKAKDTASDED